MNNVNKGLLIMEDLIREVAILNLELSLKAITEDKFNEEIKKLEEDKYFSGTLEKLGLTAAKQIIDLINSNVKVGAGEKYIVRFEDEVTLIKDEMLINGIVDVTIFTENKIIVIKIIATDYDFIVASECKGIFALGYGVVEKNLTISNADTVELIVVQPNLNVASTCTVATEDLIEVGEVIFTAVN